MLATSTRLPTACHARTIVTPTSIPWCAVSRSRRNFWRRGERLSRSVGAKKWAYDRSPQREQGIFVQPLLALQAPIGVSRRLARRHCRGWRRLDRLLQRYVFDDSLPAERHARTLEQRLNAGERVVHRRVFDVEDVH